MTDDADTRHNQWLHKMKMELNGMEKMEEDGCEMECAR